MQKTHRTWFHAKPGNNLEANKGSNSDKIFYQKSYKQVSQNPRWQPRWPTVKFKMAAKMANTQTPPSGQQQHLKVVR